MRTWSSALGEYPSRRGLKKEIARVKTCVARQMPNVFENPKARKWRIGGALAPVSSFPPSAEAER